MLEQLIEEARDLYDGSAFLVGAFGEVPAKEQFANVHYRRAFLLLTRKSTCFGQERVSETIICWERLPYTSFAFVVGTCLFPLQVARSSLKKLHYAAYFAAAVMYIHGLSIDPELKNQPTIFWMAKKCSWKAVVC